MNIYSIYLIINKVNRKCYVGYTSDFEKRLLSHKTNSKKSNASNMPLYHAIRKYGWNNFSSFEIYCSKDKEHTFRTMEQYFIDLYNSQNEGYNVRDGGEGTLGGIVKNTVWINDGTNHKRVPSNKIPEGWSKGRLNLNKNRKLSEEAKSRIGAANRKHSLKKIPCERCGKLFNKGNLTQHNRAKVCV